jgi:non-specific protein-tyrosine kinase
MAIALANGWAQQYTAFRRQYDTAGYRQAAADLRNSAAQLKARGQRANAVALNAKAASLETIAQLQTGNSSVANLAFGAGKIAPSLKREVGIGIGLGLVLGIGLAFLWDAFDTRVRGPEDVTRRTGLVLMARIPPPPRKLGPDELVMFTEPASVEAEAFRVLRTNLEFATLDLDARSIMLTSALEKEGKSTTISNLAIAQARAGKRVALVDLDLRRPRLDKLFRLTGQPGLTNVVLGHATLDEATAHIALDAKSATRLNGSGNGNGAGHAPMDGRLDVIPSGPIPPDPGEFVSAASLGTLLETLESRYDLVLIDTPPILRVGDALTLAPRVSAVLVVTRIPGMKRPVLSELRRMLEVVPSPVLGFVLTGDVGSENYHAGYYYDYRQRTSGQLAVPVTPTRPRQ